MSEHLFQCSVVQSLLGNNNVVLDEGTIKADTRKDFTKERLYKRFENISLELLKKIEEPQDYKKEFAEHPYESISDELDTYYFVVHTLAAQKLEGFPDKVVDKVNKLLKSALNSVKAAERIYAKLPEDVKFEDVPSAFTYMTYTKRTVVLLGDFFSLLDIPWDFPSFYVKPKEVWAHYGTSDDGSTPFKSPRALGLTKDSKEFVTGKVSFAEARQILRTAQTATELFTLVDIANEGRMLKKDLIKLHKLMKERK